LYILCLKFNFISNDNLIVTREIELNNKDVWVLIADTNKLKI